MSKICARWQSFRADVLRNILGHKTKGEANDIYSHIAKYESHPISITHLKNAMHDMHIQGRGWTEYDFLSFKYDMPLPSGFDSTYSNRWIIVVNFFYHKKKQIFKIAMRKSTWPLTSKIPLYGDVPKYLFWDFLRKGTTIKDLTSDTFLYTLRDRMGVYLTKVKYTTICQGSQSGPKGRHLCGNKIHVENALCHKCRQVYLKRKFEEI